MSQFIAPGISALALGVLIAISPAPKFETRAAANEAGVRAADGEWSQAIRARDVDRIASLYAGDATLFPRDEEELKGRTEIREGWSLICAVPGFSLNTRMTRIEVKHEGGALSYGTYEAVMLDDQKRRVAERGERTVFWYRYPDGSWKIGLEIYTPDSPHP